MDQHFAGETQALADGLGHTEWLACHLAELKRPEFSLAERSQYFQSFGIQSITDCKSIYDHSQACASPGSVGDKRVATDLVIVKESLKRLWGSIRWAPTWLQLADAPTKENPDAMDILRGATKTQIYHLNNESVMLKSAAEPRALRSRAKTDATEDLGSEVLFVRDHHERVEMVKVTTQGCSEMEVRALLERMVDRFTKDEEDFMKHITQTRASCKARIPLNMVNSKAFRGETSLATFNYTKSTQMVTVHAGAAFLDTVEDTFKEVMDKFKNTIQKNEIYPMMEGAGEWSEVFRSILVDGATSQYLDSEMEKKPVDEKPSISLTQALTPQEDEFKALRQRLRNFAMRGLGSFSNTLLGSINTCSPCAGNLELNLSWLWNCVD